MTRSDYEYNVVENMLLITDRNLGGMSVTNDIENVLTAIRAEGVDTDGLEIVYRDSEGLFCGVLESDGGIIFAGNGKTPLEARQFLRRLRLENMPWASFVPSFY